MAVSTNASSPRIMRRLTTLFPSKFLKEHAEELGVVEPENFATRVNLLLIIGGFYCIYRLFVQGSRVRPNEMAPGFNPLVGTIICGLSFVGPIIIYEIAALIWFYFSFWQIHRRMVREREQRYCQEMELFDDEEDGEFRTTPAWPIETGKLFSVSTATLGPLLRLLELTLIF